MLERANCGFQLTSANMSTDHGKSTLADRLLEVSVHFNINSSSY